MIVLPENKSPLSTPPFWRGFARRSELMKQPLLAMLLAPYTSPTGIGLSPWLSSTTKAALIHTCVFVIGITLGTRLENHPHRHAIHFKCILKVLGQIAHEGFGYMIHVGMIAKQ